MGNIANQYLCEFITKMKDAIMAKSAKRNEAKMEEIEAKNNSIYLLTFYEGKQQGAFSKFCIFSDENGCFIMKEDSKDKDSDDDNIVEVSEEFFESVEEAVKLAGMRKWDLLPTLEKKPYGENFLSLEVEFSDGKYVFVNTNTSELSQNAYAVIEAIGKKLSEVFDAD